jgi:hypothetical protein
MEQDVQGPRETKQDEVKKDDAPKVSLLKKWFIYIVIGGLVIGALIAIIAVLIGEWNDSVTRAMWLVASSWVHSLIALGITSINLSPDQRAKHRGIIFNTLYVLTVASLLTTIMLIAKAIPNDEIGTQITLRLYLWYFCIYVSSAIVSSILNFANGRDLASRVSAYVSAGAMAVFMALWFPPIFSHYLDIPDIFYRIIIVLAIISSISMIIAITFGILWRVKHPELFPEASSQFKPVDSGSSINNAEFIIIDGKKYRVQQQSQGKEPMSAGQVILIVIGVVIGIPILIAMLNGLLGI